MGFDEWIGVGDEVGGKRSIPGRSSEGQDFIALWNSQCIIPLDWALVNLAEDYDGQ